MTDATNTPPDAPGVAGVPRGVQGVPGGVPGLPGGQPVIPTAITVLLVDDHPLVRAGLATLMANAADLSVVGEAAGGDDAVRLATALRPDVVLMDLSMPGIDGVEATRRLLAVHPTAAVVILTSFNNQARVRDAVRAGAVGYLLKDSEPTVLLDAVRSAARGDAPLDPRVARALMQRPADGARPPTRGGPDSPAGDQGSGSLSGTSGGAGGDELSGREGQVLRLITEGLSNKQIGTRLGISERTVKVHVSNLFRRIGVADRTSAAMWARDHL
ncbi:response regulator transcription factor [Subtercola sp. YIM 133946]|uniref:response regulator transcription factor n=1 Tax=Subtercola sp. YIM 133946 TaxID=3118909 RepID=UPI002F926B61